jgi:Na+/alanine symporter
MLQAFQSWVLPGMLIVLGLLGAIGLFRLLLLPVRSAVRAVGFARAASTDRKLLSPLDAFCLTTGATALGALFGTATAIAVGGPGAVTWVVMGGLASSALRYAEGALAWQTRGLFGDGQRMSASLAPVLRGMSPVVGKPLAVAYAVFAILAIALSLGADSSAELGDTLASAFGDPARFAPVALGLLALAVTWRSPSSAGRLVRTPLLAVLAVTALLLVIAALSGASRIPGALGRMLEQAFTGGAPAAGFLGAVFAETLRAGLSRGIFTGSSLGVAAALHGGSGAQTPHRAGLVASLEPIAASVLLPILIGLAVVSTRAWNTQHEMAAPLAETQAYLREPASAAELSSSDLTLDGIIRVREGQSFDRFFLAVHRGLINEPRFQVAGKPWDGAIRFEDGKVIGLLQPTGRFGSLDEIDLGRAQRIIVTGEGPLAGAPLLGHTFSSFLPKRWGTPVAALLLLAFGVVFSIALVIAADALGGGLAGAAGSRVASIFVAGCIASAPFWVRGPIPALLPVAAVLAAIPYAIALGAGFTRVLPLEDEDTAASRRAARR